MDESTRLLYERLRLWGFETEKARERFLGDDALLLRCLLRFPSDPAFRSLREALDRKDLTAAWNAAHTLKGSAATLELTPIRSIAQRIQDALGDTSCSYENETVPKAPEKLAAELFALRDTLSACLFTPDSDR